MYTVSKSIASVQMMAFSLNTCTQPGTPLINGFVDHATDL